MAAKAFSLLECLCVLTILAIISLIAWPSLQWYQKQHQANNAILSLQQALMTCQSLAILRHQSLSLCPSLDQRSCQNQWRGTLLIFLDTNNNGQPANTDDIIAYLPFQPLGGTVSWRNFRKRNHLQFNDLGILQQDNGTFTYCANTHEKQYTRLLGINNHGRIHVVTPKVESCL
jgi:type IV fimbrial biogenesis protein FimT